MRYTSTRNTSLSVSSAHAITKGLSAEGGLFLPESIPALDLQEIAALSELDYSECAEKILGAFLTDFTKDELRVCVRSAYSGKFDSDQPVKIQELNDRLFLLELWHGPTCAFKDMALQLLPHLLTASAKKVGENREIVILTATSGDTGKAALEGFRDVPGTKIIVYYPSDGVSDIQKLQMITQEGENVSVCGIDGNFDQAQSCVKQFFTDCALNQKMADAGKVFSSANSINWGRLAPQIVYYFFAYGQLLKSSSVSLGEKINIVVPTGNFGNILAAYFAKRMGLPVSKLICASNANHILTDFLSTGLYDRNRPFHTTLSPSMDILISSNLERLLFLMTGGDAGKVSGWMKELAENGRYDVGPQLLNALQQEFACGFCDDDETRRSIADTFERYNYLLDTHTAVAMEVCKKYRQSSGDNTVTVIASTASPFKFASGVLEALGVPADEQSGALLTQLSSLTKLPIPAPLVDIEKKPVRFAAVYSMPEVLPGLIQFLKLKGD
jgi:threonine synthase